MLQLMLRCLAKTVSSGFLAPRSRAYLSTPWRPHIHVRPQKLQIALQLEGGPSCAEFAAASKSMSLQRALL
jgi:hypothetical protein